MRALTIFLFCFLVSVSPAHAWNAAGHQLTAEIAFKQLDVERQRQIAAILRAHPRFAADFAAAMPAEIKRGSLPEQDLWIFRRASIWPDIVPNISESVRNRYHRGTWHYINLPVFLTPADRNELEGTLEHNVSVQFEPPLKPGLNIIQALQGNLRIWRDAAATDADKAVALCWILHLTGDLHQPLHTVALFSRSHFPAGDRGGNSIRIQHEPKPTNLHSVWDGLVNGLEDRQASAATRAMLANDNVALDSPAAWSRSHARLAAEYGYPELLRSDLQVRLAEDDNAALELAAIYLSNARDLAKDQVIAAGHRIAALLSH